MPAVFGQSSLEPFGIDAVPPVAVEQFHLESKPARDFRPASRELADVECEDAIPRR
jgi:hypothetical protein